MRGVIKSSCYKEIYIKNSMPSLSTTAQKLMVQVQEQRKGPLDAIK